MLLSKLVQLLKLIKSYFFKSKVQPLMIHNSILDEKIHVVIQTIVGSNVHLSLSVQKNYVKYEFCRYLGISVVSTNLEFATTGAPWTG